MTGSTGFVGGHFLSNHSNEFEIQTVDLRKTEPCQIDFSHVESVVHCAALVHQMGGAPEEEYFSVNFELTMKLAHSAKAAKVQQFVFLSTAHVFGDSGQINNHSLVLGPKDQCDPSDAYGKSKLAAENELMKLNSPKFTVSILRPPMVYGKGAKGNILKLAKVIRAFPVLPLGFIKNRRSLIYVGNLSFYIKKVLELRPAGILLPQDDEPISTFELSKFITEAFHKKTILLPIPSVFVQILHLILRKQTTRLFGTLALDSRSTRSQLDITKLPTSTAEGIRIMLSGD